MGIPQHFSLELPQRCQQLISELYENVPTSKDSRPAPFKLKATFLLAISMPMINLPLERIEKYLDGKPNPPAGHMNDAIRNRHAAKAIKSVVDNTIKLQKAPFFVAGAWRYCELPKGTRFPDLAGRGLPQDIATTLNDKAAEAGPLITTQLFCSILRNSLAHGGILFLNEQGQSTSEDPVQKFAFVTTNRMRNPNALHFLRVGMKDYREFLAKWAKWLEDSGLQKDLSDKIPAGTASNTMVTRKPAARKARAKKAVRK